MSDTATLPYVPRPPSPKTRPKTANAYREARQLQDLVMNAARDKDAKGVSLASLARAWMDLERLRRDMRMLPKPKPVDVTPRVKANRPAFDAPTPRSKKPPTTKNIASDGERSETSAQDTTTTNPPTDHAKANLDGQMP